jgi:hypothetical protein
MEFPSIKFHTFFPTGLKNCTESAEISACFKNEDFVKDSSQDTEFSSNNIELAKHLYRNLPTPANIIVHTNENDNKSQAPEAYGKDSSEIEELIRQLVRGVAAIENVLHRISQARNLLEPGIAPQETPSTIFTVKKVSKTFSSESAGQRLHRKAVERQRRFAARRLEAQNHAPPRLYLVATESRRKSNKMSTYSCKCSKEPIRKCGTENNSVHTASTGTSRTMSTETSSNCSALKVKKIQMNQESNVYARLNNNAKARTKRINDKKRNELECSKEKSPAVKVKLHTDRKLKRAPDSLSQKCLKQLEHDFRNNCEGSGKNEFQIYKNQFTTAMKLNYYKHKRETYKCLGGYKD